MTRYVRDVRLDHIAYRVADRVKTAGYLISAFGYSYQDEFDLVFDDGSTTRCIALEPGCTGATPHIVVSMGVETHAPHEVFVSDGSPGSIVGRWVAERGGIGGIHHLAYEVEDVASTMREWMENGWAEFASASPHACPGLTQVFTTPHPLTGVVYELISRTGTRGFCRENVRNLMVSSDSNP